MKQFKKLIAIAVLFFGVVSFTNAQTKVAHINTQELISSMPEMKNAKDEFDKLQKSLGADIQASVTEYRNKLTQYTNEAPNKTDAENNARKKELAELEQRIQEAQAAADKTTQQKYIDLTKPIQEKALAAIQKVARAQGFQYVLDETPGSGVLFAEGTNLMDAVKKELGIK
ncbi:periplasmic chaperone for outer membrane proteins Skp [Kordia periserrulae]|uniref:Periplasmic chaperone for outer membrane proteins Skp n=1 Tax=Kordia periserrulae TaxID=701523 RepID=A0A2T6C659_9FLAO|nr:OmpH family outer membrane protein [Kordia periserrulae]PTX63809.1 periplasmic chaperone for outer membrane proteins Skp [Kordia periserrulae]